MTRPKSPIRSAFADHPALAITLLSGGIIIARLLAVAGYHVDTALGLLASAGAANVIVGTTILLIPYVLVIGAAIVVAATLFGPRFAGHRIPMAGLSVLLVAVAAQGGPAMVLVITLLTTTIGAFYQRRVPAKAVATVSSDWEYASLVIPVVAILLTFGTPWLPPELVTVSGHEVFGYVVTVDSNWTTILAASDRELSIVESSTVTGRELCQVAPNVLTVTLPDALTPRAGVPVCPAVP